jgi:hypothetical protein
MPAFTRPSHSAAASCSCGSRATRIANFRNDVKKSLDELVKAGFLKEWSHDPRGDTISVVRRPRLMALPAS